MSEQKHLKKDTEADRRKRREAAAPLLSRQTWLTPYADALKRVYGASPDAMMGALAKYLRPLENEHGPERVLEQFQGYINATRLPYVSWPKFAAGFGGWFKLGHVTVQEAKRPQPPVLKPRQPDPPTDWAVMVSDLEQSAATVSPSSPFHGQIVHMLAQARANLARVQQGQVPERLRLAYGGVTISTMPIDLSERLRLAEQARLEGRQLAPQDDDAENAAMLAAERML